MSVALTLNGKTFSIEGDPGRRLSDFLRESAGQLDVKIGCDAGDCGACTVLLDDAPVCACLMPVAQARGRSVTTAQGLGDNALSSLQAAFLRHGAAQCGICTPGMLTAGTALLAETPAPTRAEAETALAGVLCRCTGYQKIVDAVCDASTTTPPEALEVGSGDFPKSVGTRMERIDGLAKVTGAEVFGADVRPLDALYVRAIRSPHHLAAFTFGDLDAWRAETSGVEAIFTAADIDGTNRFGVIPAMADQPALAEHTARFKGEAVAIIAGDRGAILELDLNDFPVRWSPITETLSPEAAMQPGARLLHDTRPGNILIRGRVAQGSAESALAASTHVVEGGFETSFVEHAYIEPEAGAAWMDGDTLVIQACTQAPVMDQNDVANVLGLPREHVRIIPSATGGGFGSKLDLSVQPLIGLVALKTGRACRMAYTRQESMASTTKRHASRMSAKIGADASGHITAMAFEGDFNTGPYASWGPTVANRVPVHASGPYRTPNYLATTQAVHTNGPNAGAFRGFGVPQAAIMQETLYDRLAEACGLDRLEFRRRNALQDGDISVCGQTLASVGIVECLDELSDPWDVALAVAAAFNATHSEQKRGVGIASCWYGCGNTSLPNPSTIRVGFTSAGQLVLHQGATDVGQGSNTVITQICADALGLPVSAFTLIGPDTALTPDCGKTSASRQTFVTGNAALAAGKALRQSILRLSNMGESARIELLPGQLVVHEGGRTQTIDLAALALDARGYALSAEETYDPPTTPLDENGQGEPYAVYGYGAHIAEVEVDMNLGVVKVTKVTAAHDLGHVINPLLAEGQIEGGVAQGLGLALMEEYLPGRTENLHDYLIPTVGDMPKIVSILVEKPDPEGPFGARGLGEHVLIPTAPAIFNAIRHATGAEITFAPALPHRVHAAIKAAQAHGEAAE